ncbi:MAG: dihydrolipoamide acetyltransferase family protein [Dehalococcoidia bacterium]
MSYKVEMPHVGESVTEAVIGKWLKQEGDRVEKYDPLVEVVTDKVTMDVPAPVDGTITKIVADEGVTVQMGEVIAEMDAEGAVDDNRGQDEIEGKSSVEPQSPGPVPDRIGTLVIGANVGPTGGAFLDTSLSVPGTSKQAERESTSPDDSAARRYSPVVTRLAAEHGIDLAAITGTGLGGRVTKKDVLAALDTGTSGATQAQVGPASDIEDRLAESSPVRRMIAAHMARSFSEIPHAWSAIEVDVTGLVQCRSARRDDIRARHGVDLTYLPLTLHAVAAGLRANPLINSSWDDGSVLLKGHINVGIAVAARDGLVVPVVRDADREGVVALARGLADLVGRARDGKLSLDDVQDGTFTLNNTGALGSVWGGAIINHPQAAILTTEAIVKRPVVVSGPYGDAIAVRSMMNICLSFDHRIIDGAEASAFLQDVRGRLESVTRETQIE